MKIFYFWPNILLQNKHCKMWNYFLKIFYFDALITNISLSNNLFYFLFIKIFAYVVFKKSILFFIFYVHYIRSLLKLKYIIFLVISKKLTIKKVFFFFPGWEIINKVEWIYKNILFNVITFHLKRFWVNPVLKKLWWENNLTVLIPASLSQPCHDEEVSMRIQSDSWVQA